MSVSIGQTTTTVTATLAPAATIAAALEGDISISVSQSGGESVVSAVLQGPAGTAGADGLDGADGLSAYEIAVNQGFVGTEEDWIASLGSGAAAWGNLTGDIANQTDLQTALSGKADTSHTHTKADVGLDQVDNTSDANKPISTATATALAGKQANLPTGTATQFLRGSDKTFVTVSKSNVGLGNVDNTSDANKPISTATATALSGKADTTHNHDSTYAALSHTHSTGEVTGLDTALSNKANLSGATFTGAVSATNLSGTNTGDETSPSILTKLSGASGGGTSNFLRADGTWAAPPVGGSPAWGDITGTLSNQTDLQTALDGKSDTTHNHDADYADIAHNHDADYAALSHSHSTGEVTGLDTALAGKEPTLSAGTTAQYYRGDKSWQTLDKAAVGLSNVDNTSDANKPISTATQTALDGKASTSHNHDGTYATASHNHDATYAAISHSHSNATTSVAGFLSASDKTKLDGIATGATANTGTVTTVSVTTANGVSGSVSNATTTPAISLTLGAITPTSVAASGTVTGTNIVQGFSYGVPSKPVASAKYPTVAPYAFTITQANCSAKAGTAATASTVFTIKKNGSTTVGTFTFAAAATTATVSITSGAISAGDFVTIEAPASQDATLADIAFLVRA